MSQLMKQGKLERGDNSILQLNNKIKLQWENNSIDDAIKIESKQCG